MPFHCNTTAAEGFYTLRGSKRRNIVQKYERQGVVPTFIEVESISNLQKSKTLADFYRRGFKQDPTLFHQFKDYRCTRAVIRVQNSESYLGAGLFPPEEGNVKLLEE